ncbi:discoidin domain-containing receptor tyrosine kinase B-like [Montipora capricornis]|uniref:discoidin domain-containing receptor tyrosine kinase B-like n=1 Tax=Montipora foliosa TaxID=591990 RepID=UPI0035F1F1B1
MNDKILLLLLLVLQFPFCLAGGLDEQQECDSSLSMSIPDDGWSASSPGDHIKFPAHKARISNTVGWCTSHNRDKLKRAFIQLDLGRNMRVTALSTAGVLVKNKTTGNYSSMYVSQYFVAYKRERDLKWRRYHKNDVSVTVIKSNSSELHKHYFLTSRIARYIRLVVVNGVGDRWCLKMDVHGCSWTKHDGLVSYRISQGNLRKNNLGWSSLRDKGYDGNRLSFGATRGLLYNGLGQLTDGMTGYMADWNDTGNPNWIDWIGWQDIKTPQPTVTFVFSSLRRFSRVRFHTLSLPGQHEKMLFSKVILSFSKDGEYFSWKTIYEPSMTTRSSRSNRAFWIEVNLDGHVGKYVTCDFQYYGSWVLISEVEFESVDLAGTEVSDTGTKITPTTSNGSVHVINGTDEINVDLSKKDSDLEESIPGIWLIAGVAGGVVAALLISLLAVLKMRRRTRRTRAENLIDRVPIRIINPSKKNSLNRRNDAGAVMRIEKQKMLERGDEEEDEEDEMDFISAKCNLNNFRNRELRGNPFKADTNVALNIRPESREISSEVENPAVLAEMRKVSDCSEG